MEAMELERRYGARNYDPLPVVLTRGEGVWLRDEAGRRYLDMMSAYSAVSHGHAHPRLVKALTEQAGRLAVASRAYYNDRLGRLLERLCALTGLDRALPMNTGAEAVETAIKAARRWGHVVKGVPEGRAEILTAEGNFHGRTTTIVGFSTTPAYQRGFGPFTPGFRTVPFGDARALEAAMGPETCAVLVEPIQGEAGIRVPPAGWLREVRRICSAHRVLLLLDEVQSGLGRTGRWFAFEHEGVRPDGVILGKALGGGLLPVSAFVGTAEVMDLFEPGSHGSTFGGNPLAAAVALEALAVLEDEQLVERSALLGRHMLERLRAIDSPAVAGVRGLGLWAGVELDPARASARGVCERLMTRGVLTKETHETVVRFAPPLVVAKAELDWGIDQVEAVLAELAPAARPAGARHPAAVARETGGQSAARPAARIAMCPPDHFEVAYAINPWMRPSEWKGAAATLRRDAEVGWRQLHDTFARLGAVLELALPQPGVPDMVFTANSAVVLDGVALLARFKHPERRAEEPHWRRFFEGLRRRGVIERAVELPESVLLEGAGDCIWDPVRRVVWMGWGQRSSREAREVVRALYGVTAISLELVDPRFYHLDTAFCPLSGGEVLYVPAAFSAEGLALIRDLVGEDRLIAAGDEDAATLAANAVCLDRDVVTGPCSEALKARLAERGYRVHSTPIGAFARSGGAAYCLTLRLDIRTRP